MHFFDEGLTANLMFFVKLLDDVLSLFLACFGLAFWACSERVLNMSSTNFDESLTKFLRALLGLFYGSFRVFSGHF